MHSPLEYLQEHLRTYGLASVCELFDIKSKPHPKYPNLVQLKYSQIDSDMSEPVVQACRGIVLDSENDWDVACHVFDKFFNQGDSRCNDLDWPSAKVFEKMDGSLVQLFHYDDAWHMTTSGSPDGGGIVFNFTKTATMTFSDLFWQTWEELKYNSPQNPDICYSFELCTPYNRVVVDTQDSRIVLLGARNRKTHKEITVKEASAGKNWEAVEEYNLKNLTEVLATLEDMNPYEQEGYVVCDKSFNRTKIKSPKYVAVHHAIGCLSPRNLLEVIRKGEGPEFLAHFKEFKKAYDEIKDKYDKLVLSIEEDYEKVKHIEDQKEFAAAALAFDVPSALFTLKNGRSHSVKEALSKVQIKNLERLLDIK